MTKYSLSSKLSTLLEEVRHDPSSRERLYLLDELTLEARTLEDSLLRIDVLVDEALDRIDPDPDPDPDYTLSTLDKLIYLLGGPPFEGH